MMSEPTDLYRHWDAEGRLLYIGISRSAVERLAGHRNNSHWYPLIKWRRGGNAKVSVALIREIVGIDDAAGGHRDVNPATSRLATEPICSAPTARAASVGAPQRQGRMVVGMFPPSANHSLQLCSRKPSCS